MAKQEQGWQSSEEVNSEMAYALDGAADDQQARDSDENDVDESAEIDPQLVEMALKKIATEQNLSMALVAAVVSSLLGAGAWALLTVVTNSQFGLVAIALGVFVGFAVRIGGKGLDQIFGFIGAGFSLLGIVGGNLFSILYTVAEAENIAFADLVAQLNPDIIFQLMSASFDPIDLLFYAFGAYEGYRFAFRKITEADLDKAMSSSSLY